MIKLLTLFHGFSIFLLNGGGRCHRGGFAGQLHGLLERLQLCSDAVPAADRNDVSDNNQLFGHLLPAVHFNGHHHRQNRFCKSQL